MQKSCGDDVANARHVPASLCSPATSQQVASPPRVSGGCVPPGGRSRSRPGLPGKPPAASHKGTSLDVSGGYVPPRARSKSRPAEPAERLSLPADSPLLIELCAGSSGLSSVAQARGFAIMPVDHGKNQHVPQCRITQIDLTSAHAWDTLAFLIDQRPIPGVHFAPPCGTCSAARGIPLADGSEGPPVLRTDAFPWGVPWAAPVDAKRLKAANSIYENCEAFIDLLEEQSIPWIL